MLSYLTPEHRQMLPILHQQQETILEQAGAQAPAEREGAGMVIVAGGGQAFTSAWVTLTVLRKIINTQLPIQIWYLGADEMSPRMREIVKQFDVTLVNACDVQRRHPMRRLGPWECKAYATLHAGFRHVILLDADNIPLADPAHLLDTPEYRNTGALFWPDNHSQLPDSPVWELFDVPWRDELEMESGQLVVDTVRCWVPLTLALHYNAWSDVYYRYVYGDKETFRFAWKKAGYEAARPSRRPATIYCQRQTPRGKRRMTAALEQTGFDGTPLFHHRTGGKWMLYGENPTTTRPWLDAACEQALEALRSCWDGRVLANPDARPLDLPVESNFGRSVRYRRIGFDERSIRLLPDGSISGSDDPMLRTWRLEGDTCVVAGQHADTARLEHQRSGAWLGQEHWYGKARVELVPLD